MILYRLKQLILVLIDLALLYLSLWFSLMLRYWELPTAQFWRVNAISFLPIFFLWLIVLYLDNLYNLRLLKNRWHFFINLLKGLAINLVLAILIFYFATNNFTPKRVLFLTLLIFAILLVFWRFVFNRFFKSPLVWNNLLIIGDTLEARELMSKKDVLTLFGFNLRALVGIEENNSDQLFIVTDYNTKHAIDNLEQLVEEEGINTVVIDNLHQNPPLVNRLYRLLSHKVRFYDLPNFYEQIFREVPIFISGEIWFLHNFDSSRKVFYDNLKRIFDFIGAIILSIILLPFFLLTIIGILIFSPGPIFYRQKRVSQDDREFILTKFRTMVVGAEQKGATWSTKNDPRITSFGRFLRATHFDEIPQLWNILKGDMSLVGPRPERPEFIIDLKQQIPHYQLRHLVRPGITGWAQINYPYGSSVEDAIKKLHYDLYYIKHRSFILDIIIILKTLGYFFYKPTK